MKLVGLSKARKVVDYNRDRIASTQTFALGGGEWSIEVYDEDGVCIKEFVGNNGTRNAWNPDGIEDDLWAELDQWSNEVYRTYRAVTAPDGVEAPVGFFYREALRYGRLHGCVAVF